MKTLIPILVTVVALLAGALRAQEATNTATGGNSSAAPPTAAPAPPEPQAAPAPETQPAPPTARESQPPPMEVSPPPTHVVADGERGLRLNFRNAPLELVLNYLSEAAGFIIVPEVDVRGRVDVWSNQPLTKDEAIEVLNQALARNGYAVLREGRTLTVVSREEARKRDIPVRRGADPESIPKNDQIVTQIIPVRFINAVQLSRDLAPLIPSTATLAANEGGNALIITDTQANVRRLAEIIKALDTSVSALSAVRVFALRYADAKTVANVLREVFANDTSTMRGLDPRARFFAFMRGGGPGGGGGGEGQAATEGRPGASRVVATADERSNSLVVSAPEDLMPTIEELVAAVDVDVEDLTEIRVFTLRHSDPQEMADLITSLFPDETTQNTAGGGRRFGFFGPPGFPGNQAANANTPSERVRKQSRVIAVADLRTSSVVVTASRQLMPQIANMIEQLDSNPARKQKVFVYDLRNAEPGRAEEIVRGLFEGQNTRRTSTTQNRSALEAREEQMLNQQTFNQGFGTTTGGGVRGQGLR
ncbi:secretin N-terminal domain-containing protein [Limisphaera sp. VF-2]|jgi:type II secretory pathway component GspD/PulD (secretin)|uniref:secretin N-terminal domain-containing protein n=1 Tax=Limisphaera sp. VF-2 TaxID=3400418 RepID=UPI003C1E749B